MISKWVSWILNFLVSFLFNFILFFLRRPIQPRTRQSGWGKWMRRINIQPSAGHTREGCATQRAVLGSIQQADRAAAETLNNNELVTNRRKITQRNSRLDFSRYLLPQQLSGLEQQFHLYYPRLYFISLNIIPPKTSGFTVSWVRCPRVKRIARVEGINLHKSYWLEPLLYSLMWGILQ